MDLYAVVIFCLKEKSAMLAQMWVVAHVRLRLTTDNH
jgi:hypothetical protein